MTLEELKVEAEKLGYGLHKSQRGLCRCLWSREDRLNSSRTKCKRYEYVQTTKQGYTVCRRKEENNEQAQ